MKPWWMAALVTLGAQQGAQAPVDDPAAQAEETLPAGDALDATQVAREWEGFEADMRQTARAINVTQAAESKAAALEAAGTFKAEHAYSIEGVAAERDSDEVTVQRAGLPPAQLEIREHTVVTLDGVAVDARYIPEGAQVRARFQLEGDEAVALRVDARTSGERPSGPAR